MLSDTLELTLRNALRIASKYNHEYATYEHLLLALIEDQDVKKFLLVKKIDSSKLVKALNLYIKNDLAELVKDNISEAKPTIGFQKIIQKAVICSQAEGKSFINGVDLLAEFFSEHNSFALKCLKETKLTRFEILDYNKSTNNNNLTTSVSSSGRRPSSAFIPPGIKEMSAHLTPVDDESINDLSDAEEELEKYCTNLNAKADKEDIDCLIGRQSEIQRTMEILCRRKKNNVILVGEPGVGKTAIAEGMATLIAKGKVPDVLKNAVIYSLEIGSLVAGTKFRGDFEERIKLMLECLKKLPNAILFIDEIHSIIGAGSTTSGALDASNLLKPALANGTLKCIGSTTFKEYHNHFEKDMALVRRFQKIIVEEPDEESTFKILQGLKGYYEEHHNVSYTDEALRAAISFSERYINDRNLPDKAIDLIDEVGAKVKTGHQKSKKLEITAKEIEELVASIIKVPNVKLDINDINQIKSLEGRLKKVIFGQAEAIENLCASIKLSRAGLKKGSKPTGCYLFVGPTGVGKTELSKQLAFLCNMRLLKYDMSEFSEANAVSKLVGSAPGYVGFDQGGVLTDEVDKYPYSVILFDEIEKANKEIYNLLLQVMDDGVLTDNSGKKISFSHSIVILTSNVATQKAKAAIGFGKKESSEKESKIDMSTLNEEFSPEFRSRLDKIIIFNPIDGIVDKIVNKNLKELEDQLIDKKVKIYIHPGVQKHFVNSCVENKEGARVLDKMIDTEIKQYIADAILFGKLKKGGSVDIDYSKKHKKFVFKFTEINKNRELETG